jgi:hypothetical protein
MTTHAEKGILRSMLDILQGVMDLLKPKERAVTMWDVYSAAQAQLNDLGTTNDFGDVVPLGYVKDVYLDSGNNVFCLYTKGDGKLYTMAVNIDDQSQITFGEETEVFMEFTPVSRSAIRIQRMKDGTARWYAAPACTAVLNRSGEIDSTKLFDSFVEYIERTGEYPEMDFFHLDERLVFGKADLVFRDGVNLVICGTFDNSDVAKAAIEAIERDGDYWGLSIAYLPTEQPELIGSTEGVTIPVFNAGILRFVSLLPEDTAASILTRISVEKEVNRMNAAQEKALREMCGDGNEKLFDQLKEQLKNNNRQASEPGVITRGKPNVLAVKNSAKPAATKAVAAKTAPETPEAPVSVERELNDEDLDALFGNEKFQAKLNDFLEARATSSETEEPVEEEGEGEEEPVTEPVAESAGDEVRALITSVNALTKKVEAWEKQRAAEAAEADDLPEKISIKQIIRPRGRSTILPQSLVAEGRQDVALADVANNTLSRINAGK